MIKTVSDPVGDFPIFRRPGDARRGRFVPLAAIILFIGISIVLAAWINASSESADERVVRTIEVRGVVDRLGGLMADAESGQRGYLLSEDAELLIPYSAARVEIQPNLSRLGELVADHPAQRARVDQLAAAVDRKLGELSMTIALVANGRLRQAVEVLRAGSGRRAMDEIRLIARAIQADEAQRLEIAISEQRRGRALNLAGILAALAGVVFLGWRELNLSSHSGQALLEENQLLEERVRERTADLDRERLRVEGLLQDVNHRVGNNLSMVAALLNVQSRRTGEPAVRAALGQAIERIQAIAAGQRRLRLDVETDEIDARQYFGDVLEEIARGLSGRPISLELDVADIRLRGRDAVPCVVLVNELVTNAVKHAFPDGMAGRVLVRLRRAEDPAYRITLSVEDDGAGMPGDAVSSGLGQQIILSLTRSMDARVVSGPATSEPARPGTRVSIDIPAQPAEPEA